MVAEDTHNSGSPAPTRAGNAASSATSVGQCAQQGNGDNLHASPSPAGDDQAVFCIGDDADVDNDGQRPYSESELHLPHLSHQSQPQPKHLSLVPLAILTFYNVSGGPFGIEATVRAGGNFYALLGFVVLPLVWSVPEAAITAELGSAYPEASGGVAWVEEAFGPKAGLMAGYLGWVAGATDNAIYPVLFLEYVTSVLASTSDDLEKELHGVHRFLIVSGTAIVLAGVNYLGLEIVGTASVVVAILAMSPFVIMCLLGLPQIDPGKWLQRPVDEPPEDLFDDDAELLPGPLPLRGVGGVFWRGFLNNLFWNLNSFDSAASFAGEVSDVSTTFPRGIFLGTILVVVGYLLPLLVATGATDSAQEEWVDGHMATVAVQIAGPWLGGWVVFSAGISNLALFEAEMSADAWQLMGMAERGYLPKVLATRSKFNTPKYGIAIGLVVIIAMSVADFSQLVEMLNFNYALSLLLEYAAFVKLRFTHRDVPRPYRIPIPDWASPLFVLIPCGMIVVLFTLASWITYIFVAAVLALGVVVYVLLDVARRRNWCEFRPQTYCKIATIDDAAGSGLVDGDEAPCTASLASEIQMTSQDDGRCHDDEIFLETSNGVMS